MRRVNIDAPIGPEVRLGVGEKVRAANGVFGLQAAEAQQEDGEVGSIHKRLISVAECF